MEEHNLPPGQSVQPSRVPTSSQMAAATAPVSSYSAAQQTYPIESLEVHQEGESTATPTFAPTMRSVPFSRRRATIVSLTITLVVILITGLVSAFFIQKSVERPASQLDVPTQDASIEGAIESDLPPELRGLEDSLLVNGDIVARGNLRVVSGSFTSTLDTATLTGNQTVTLPDLSGEICLSANNCNFVTQAQLTQIQPVDGVDTLNDFAGSITIQGSLNQVAVTSEDGTITLSTPQALDANANVQFGSLRLNGLGTGSGVLTQSGAGSIALVTAGGAGQCLISTAGAPAFQACPGGGGGGVTSLNSLAGALTLQGTANQINVASGGSTITLSTPQDIATTSNVTFNSGHITTGMAIGSNTSGVDPTRNGLVINHDITGDCSFGCHGLNVTAESTVNSVLTTGTLSRVHMSNGGTFSAAAFYAGTNSVAGTGGITDNYGLFVDSQTAGGNDYGIYVEGADTYALWIDSGISRFDGNLEFEGATDNAFETTLTVADPTADNTITLPNATGTVCLTSGNCAGIGGTGDILNNGQNGPIRIGTNNATSLFLESNNTDRIEVQSDGDVAVDTSTLFVDATNNRVGIGTATPQAPLEISGSANNYTRINETGAGTYNLEFMTNAFGKVGSIVQGYSLNITSEEQVTFGPSGTPRLTVNVNEPNGAGILVSPASATQVGAVIRGFASQTADLLQIQNSSGVAMLMVNPSGQLVFEGSTDDANEVTIAVANPTADRTYTIPHSTAASDTFCLLSLGNCFGAGTGGTLQAAYVAGNTITTTDGRDIDITLNNTTTDPNFLIDIATGSTGRFAVQGNNTDIFSVTPTGITITSESSGSRVISGRFNYDTGGTGATTYIQTSEVNDDTYLGLVANGTGDATSVVLYGNGLGGSHARLEYISDVALNLVATNELSNSGGSINLVTKPGGGGVETNRLTIDGNGVTTFNPTGTDSDFSIQGDTDANLFYVDAGNNRIGIGDATPAATFTVGSGDLFQVAGASGNITTSGDVAVNGGDLSSSASAFNVTNSHATGTIALRTNSLTRLTVSNSSVTSTVPYFASDGQDFAPGYAFTNDTDTGLWRPGDNLLAVVTSGAERVRFGETYRVEIQSSTGIEIYNSGSPLDLDIAGRESTNIRLDEDDDDSGESFNVVTNNGNDTIFSVVESSGKGIAFIQGWLRLGVDAVNIPDNGGGTPATLSNHDPFASYMEITCSDANGCDVTLNDTNSSQGQTVFIVNMGTNTVNFADTAGQQELSANPVALGQYDTLTMIYSDRWIQYATSNNL